MMDGYDVGCHSKIFVTNVLMEMATKILGNVFFYSLRCSLPKFSKLN